MGDETPVQKFYKGGHILITGGTGFLGKALIEKLLRSCPGIDKIYLLIRLKKEVDPAGRLEILLSDKLFERVKIEVPNFAEKLEVVPGDCAKPFLGISPEHRKLLSEKVNIVFHSAANVKLVDNLKRACAINIVGTKHVLEFCKSLKNLKSVIHVSTIYSNCCQYKVEDKFYYPPLCHDRIEKLCEALTEDEIDILTPHLLQEWPNTYSFTKAIAETKTKSLGVDLPICIFRPGIVTASYAEPVPGWVDNFNGPSGVYLNSWLGIQKTVLTDRNAKSNLVPVDLTANALILVAKSACDSHGYANLFYSRVHPGEVPIYGFESNSVNPVNWGKLADGIVYWTKYYPSIHACGLNYTFYIRSKAAYGIIKTFYETIPGYFTDLYSSATGRKPRMIKLYKIIHTSVDTIGFFATRTLNCESKNMGKLLEHCAIEDRRLFFCNLKEIDWNDYVKNYLLGIRKYLMKESDDTIEKAKVRQRKLFGIYVASRITLLIILAWMAFVLYEKIN